MNQPQEDLKRQEEKRYEDQLAETRTQRITAGLVLVLLTMTGISSCAMREEQKKKGGVPAGEVRNAKK